MGKAYNLAGLADIKSILLQPLHIIRIELVLFSCRVVVYGIINQNYRVP